MNYTPWQVLVTISLGLAFLLLYIWSAYNSMIRRRNQVKTDFSDIDIQLKRRSSLIQNLVDLVKDYARHEKETFENVAKARAAVDTSKTAGESARADNMLTQTLRSLFMVVENYPKLQASDNYKQLREDLVDTEFKFYEEEFFTATV
ncbi:MAG: LemA protein [Candidatus Gottesmanbacteria bacterium GW2011_GWA1_42_26]|nr:MAG: LemA protein [Candidatus Gottesmanbacteria bacterium GW2011_GWA1_42_26]